MIIFFEHDDFISSSIPVHKLIDIHRTLDVESDEFLRNLISHDIGYLHIKKLCVDEKQQTLYQIDLDHMNQYDVRQHYSKYGGRVVFNKSFNVYCIDYLGKTLSSRRF